MKKTIEDFKHLEIAFPEQVKGGEDIIIIDEVVS